MEEKKDWSYFQYKVGRYEPYYSASEEEKKKFKPYEPNNKFLKWYVFDHDFNSKEIYPVNVFELSITFIRGLLIAKKKYKDNYIKFAETIRSYLQYSYWSKCEYETIITSWPPYIDEEELNRLIKERDEQIANGNKFFREDVSLETGYKIDIYTQVMLNWDRFIDYLWSNKHLITKKKLGVE